jgi:hypothetical protein
VYHGNHIQFASTKERFSKVVFNTIYTTLQFAGGHASEHFGLDCWKFGVIG